MINQDEYLKELLEKLKDENGKIMITDDMSDDLKQALTIINAENIDIFSPKYSDEELDRMDMEEFEEDETEELDVEDEDSDDSMEINMNDNIVEDDSVDISDLNDLF